MVVNLAGGLHRRRVQFFRAGQSIHQGEARWEDEPHHPRR